MTPAQQRIIEWLANGETGLSSEAIAFWLGFDVKPKDSWNYPHDPADLDRCLRLLDRVPEMRPHLPRMAKLGRGWAALVKRWDEIEASHVAEVGVGWTKARSAPLTYKLMRSILDPVERTR